MSVLLKRGALIVIEGVDRSGKSTQCKRLVESLQNQNIPAKLMNFPNRETAIGRVINDYLKNADYKLDDHAIHLLFSANRWESAPLIQKLINDGVTVVVDRYSYSGIVFTSIKENMSIDWCKQPENGLPKPDLVFFLNLPSEEVTKRKNFGKERYENDNTQRKAASMFNQLCKTNDNWLEINAANTIESIQESLLEETVKKIRQVESTLLNVLTL